MSKQTNVEKNMFDIDELLNNCEDLEPEERIADFLESFGFIKKKEGKYQLTEIGEKFLKLPIE